MEATAPVLDQKPRDLVFEEIATEISNYRQKKGGPVVALIDGKAAAGKSTMAEDLAKRLNLRNQPVCIIEADWFLKDRAFRTAELEKIIDSSTVYANSHIQFWNWSIFKTQLAEVYRQAHAGGTVTLTNLYDRSTGESNADLSVIVPKNAVILAPGCYLLSQDLNYDLAIMLYVNKEVGRSRKLDREYQKSKTGIFPSIKAMGTMMITWDLLEEPTFFRHMIKNGDRANIIIDTSGPGYMSVIKFEMMKTQVIAVRGRAIPNRTEQAIAGFIKAQSDVGKEIVELIQSGKAGTVKVREDDMELTVSME